MASQGGRLTVTRYYGKKLCGMCEKNRARWYITCSPQFFMIINQRVCTPCKKKCEECTVKNKPVKSALD